MHILISYHEENMQSYKMIGTKLRGIALTGGTHCLYIDGENWLSSQCGKSDKKCSNNYTQMTCTPSYHEENTCKIIKGSVQKCKRSCDHCLYTRVLQKVLSLVRITSVLRFIKHIFITNLQSIPPLLKHIFVTFLPSREKQIDSLFLVSVGDTDK